MLNGYTGRVEWVGFLWLDGVGRVGVVLGGVRRGGGMIG